MEEILLRAETAALPTDELQRLFRCAHPSRLGRPVRAGRGGATSPTPSSVLDRMRNGELELSDALISLLLESPGPHRQPRRRGRRQPNFRPSSRARRCAPASKPSAPRRPPPPPHCRRPWRRDPIVCSATEVAPAFEVGGSVALGAEHWHLSLRFAPGVLRNGMDPLAFIHYLRTLGGLAPSRPSPTPCPEFAAGDPENCYLGFEIALAS